MSRFDHIDTALYGTDTRALCKDLRKTLRVIEFDGEKLPNIYERFLRDKQFYTLYIRSHMGSGKTFQLKNIIRNLKRSAKSVRKPLKVLIITPKRTFASYVSNQLSGFLDYRKVTKPYSSSRHPRFVVQLQSLKHFDEIESDSFSVKGYSIVIMDETHSIVDELFSDLLTPAQRRRCLNIFSKVLRAIPRWICLDAHLSLDLINILNEIDNQQDLHKTRMCLVNHYRREDFKVLFFRKCLYNGTVIRLLRTKLNASSKFKKYKPLLSAQKIRNLVINNDVDKVEKIFLKTYKKHLLGSNDRNDILVDLNNSLIKGQKVCVTTATKRQAFILKNLFKDSGFKVRLLTGDSSESKKRNFAQNPDRFIRGCQLFIYTTAFQVGIDVSSSKPYFDTHYVFLEVSTRIASPGALVQAVGRIRTTKRNEFKVAVMDGRNRKVVDCMVSSDNLVPRNANTIMPVGNSNSKIAAMLTNYHYKEKALGENTYLYLDMFVRLLSCKARACVVYDGEMHRAEDTANFLGFHFSNQEYEKFVDHFIENYEEEIKLYFDKQVNHIWRKLEASSIYVSTLVNNFDAFLTIPEEMNRSECVLKICEFTTLPFGFLYCYIFARRVHWERKLRYFESVLGSYFPKCEMRDLEVLKSLFVNFLKTCNDSEDDRLEINTSDFDIFLGLMKEPIVCCYTKFVSTVVSKSSKIRNLFCALLSKTLRLNVFGNQVDLTELNVFRRLIDIDKFVDYNSRNIL